MRAALALTTSMYALGACADDGASTGGAIPDCIELDLDVQSCAPLFPATYERLHQEVFAGLDGQSGCAAGGSACHANADAAGAGGGMIFNADADATYDAVSMFIEAGEPACGPLSVRVHSDDAAIRMPPGDSALAEGARCALAQWIAQGAPR